MSTTLDDIAYEMHLENLAENEVRKTTIDEFRETILRRYYLKNPDVLKRAHSVNTEAINLFKNGHYSASMVFSFNAVELLIKEVITRPLLHGNVIEESIADYITDEILKKMKNYSQYSTLFNNFITTYTAIDLKNYQEKNLIKEFEELQKLRNDILHQGIMVNKADAIHANKISGLYYKVLVDVMESLGLKIDKTTWKIERK